MTNNGVVHSGLEGVVVAETRLSEVDGEKGRLIIAGHDVETLALTRCFEDVLELLWAQHLPNDARKLEISRALGKARVAAFEQLIASNLTKKDGMDCLRAAMASLTVPETMDEGIFVSAAVAVVVAAWAAVRSGEKPVAPSENLGHTADYLRMVMRSANGVDEDKVRALDTYLVTVADHGMNASTFVARTVASTASDLLSSIVAAIGALKGPLHGGAPGPVLDMLDAIGKPENAVYWLSNELKEGRRIMGMGHRVYRVRDPRAAVLEKATLELEKNGIRTETLSLARAVEKAAEGILKERYPNRPLHANVEFYTAVLLDTIGLPRELFTPTFAVGRVLGWCAHVHEQRQVGRLIRPASRYVGLWPGEIVSS